MHNLFMQIPQCLSLFRGKSFVLHEQPNTRHQRGAGRDERVRRMLLSFKAVLHTDCSQSKTINPNEQNREVI
jgi:hypothetical protein